eukprot:CAMPEP_0176025108 /NCGR_PEP_ID=MMETSP0120_2-20121206/12278_1 /TAXON_ID=160619 /ORGANISM="Kryptoperidinium foliaceum, Strain CCMP 1326" /LENGTH=362 /DNA_ID=CAMNT_0017358289 /DNA_START=192 /DNA_END=1280 /DNA_ORIENTATION=+
MAFSDAEAARAEEAVMESSTVSRRFKLMDRVIAGNYASTILLGAAHGSSRQVVIKVLLKKNFASDEELRSAQDEVAIHAALLPHPNVLKHITSEETPEAILLVTPFVKHGDLWSLMQYSQTYDEGQVRNCAAQMLSATRHLHDVCGLIHADIKPHNFLLVQKHGRFAVQLCDFGFTERPGPDGFVSFTSVRGTSGWFAPEMLRHKDYSFALDLFGLGLIVFRMLGGYAPFDPPSKFQDTVDYDERCWSHVSSECRELVSKLLSLSPADRGTAAEALAALWVCGPEPRPLTAEQLKALSSYGPPPNTAVEFWSLADMPELYDGDGDVENSTVARSHCDSSDDDHSDFGDSLPSSPSSLPSPSA